MSAVTAPPIRLPSLTGLRALAAGAVLLWHAHPDPLVSSSLTTAPFVAGQSGVLFFFLLSGFVLTWVWRPGDSTAGFYWRRVARVVPNHVVTWTVAAVVLVAVGSGLDWGDLTSLGMIGAWIPDGRAMFGGNGPSWSLSCEMFFYLCFPLLVGRIRGLGTTGLRILFAGALAAMTAVELAALVSAGAAVSAETSPTVWGIYMLPPVRMLEFVMGVVAALEVQRGHRWNVGLWPAVVLVAVAFEVAGLFPRVTVAGWLLVVPFLLLITAAVDRDVASRGSLFSGRLAVWCGERSFAFYLTQTLFIAVFHLVSAQGTVGHLGVQLANLACGLVAAYALHRWVELPCERQIRARFAHRGRRLATAAGATP